MPLPSLSARLLLALAVCCLASAQRTAQAQNETDTLLPSETPLLSETRSYTNSESPEAARALARQDILEDAEVLDRQLNFLKKLVRFARPSVVHIETRRTGGGSGEFQYTRGLPAEEAGAGVLVTYQDKHYVLTNRHVIHGASPSSISITLEDGRVIHPAMVHSDRETDVAVLRVSAPRLVPGVLGDSGTVDIGEFVFAVGSPFGLSQTVTYGIVSAKGRRDLQLGQQGLKFQNFMQTDAAINPGNSGGPLFNSRGEVIGINTAIASNSGGNDGIGFTIPINSVMAIARQLIHEGKVSRAFLGVVMDSQFTAKEAEKLGLTRARGAKVNGLTADSPADQAGIRVGDVILRFNGQEVEDDSQLIHIVSLSPLDDEVRVEVFRGGKIETLKLRLADRGKFNTGK